MEFTFRVKTGRNFFFGQKKPNGAVSQIQAAIFPRRLQHLKDVLQRELRFQGFGAKALEILHAAPVGYGEVLEGSGIQVIRRLAAVGEPEKLLERLSVQIIDDDVDRRSALQGGL